MPPIEVVSDSIIDKELIEEQLNLTKKKAKWNEDKWLLGPVVNALFLIGIEPSLSSGSLNVSFSGDKAKLAAAIRILRVAGFVGDGEKPKKGDDSWYSYFHHPRCELQIWFYFTSTVCKKVKVGTKLVEQDVYEVQCGDITIDEDPQLTQNVAIEQRPAL